MLTELSNAGYGDIAYELLMQDTYPSWGYWLANGSDSAWEAWPISARSYNHYFLATYDDWFFTHLAGIRDVKNGYETVTLKPEIYTGLGYVDCSIDTVRGTLESSWGYNESGALVWTVRVPVGTTATVYLPFDCASVNGKAFAKQEGITVNADNLTVLSGEYSFTLDTSVLEKEALGETIAMCETYNANNYPAEQFASFTEVFDAAKAVYNTENATAEELYNANTELLDAMEVLAEHAFGNIARGKAVSVSSDVSGYGWSKEKLTDGDRINKNSSTGQHLGWSSNQSTATDHAEWVTVDLGAYYKFDKVCIMPSGNKTEDQLCEGFPKNFTISVSMDGESWTTLVNETNYTVPYATLQEFEVDMSYARYVRLYASSLNPLSNDGNRYRMQLSEIEVYNSNNYLETDTDVVYVADGGNGSGLTSITPVGSMADAFAVLNGEGGRVVLVGDTTVNSILTIPEMSSDLTITAINGAKLLIASRVQLENNTNDNVVTFDCPVDVISKADNFIFGGFNSVVFTDNFVVTSSGGGKINFFGGVHTAAMDDSAKCITELPYSITVNNGTFNAFAGGSYRSSINAFMSSIAAPVELTINGGTFGPQGDRLISANNSNTYGVLSVSGASILADNAKLTINGGTFNVPIFVQGAMGTIERAAAVLSVAMEDKKYYAIDGDIALEINGGTFKGGTIGAYYTQVAYTSLMRGNFDVSITGGTFKEGTTLDATQVKAYAGSDKKATLTNSTDVAFNVVRFDVVNGVAQSYEEPLRVAFIGDSITEGYTVSGVGVNRLTESYPAVFTKLCEAAGKEVVISNYGVAGSGFHKSASAYYGGLVSWPMVSEETDPDIVFFAMGTNNAHAAGGTNGAFLEFVDNYEYFITTMGGLSSVDKVYITNAIYRSTDSISDHRASSLMRPLQEKIAKTLAAQDSKYVFVDLFGLTLAAAKDGTLFADNNGVIHEQLHPAKQGLALMGEICYNAAFNGVYVTTEDYHLTDIYVSDSGTPFGAGTADDPISDIDYAFDLMARDTEVTLHIDGTSTWTEAAEFISLAPSKLTIVGVGDDATIVMPSATTVKFGTNTKLDNLTLQANASAIMLFGCYNDIEITQTVSTVGVVDFFAGYNLYGVGDPFATSTYDTVESASSAKDCNIVINGGSYRSFMLGNFRFMPSSPLGTYSGKMLATVGANVTVGDLAAYTGIVGHNYVTGAMDVTVNGWSNTTVRKYAPISGVVGDEYDIGNNTGTVNIVLADNLGIAVDNCDDIPKNNIALGKTVSVSSDVAKYGWIKDALTDGDMTNIASSGQHVGWSSANSVGADHVEWVIIDLESNYDFNRVCIMPSGAKSEDKLSYGFPRSFTISVSDDADKWTTVVTATDCTIPFAILQIFDFDTVNARYVKLEATSLNRLLNDGNYYRMQLSEIEVYLDNSKVTMDVDGNGIISLADALMLLKLIVNGGDASLLDVLRILKQIAS